MTTARIVDADGHIMEPANLWIDHLESRFKERAMSVRTDNEGLEYLQIDGKKSRVLNGGQLGSLGLLDEEMAPRRGETFTPGLLDFEDCTPLAAVDPHARIKWMDEQGIDITILYPSLGLNWQSECEDTALAVAHCRVYNNWITDFCASYPNRLIPTASISLLDVDEGVKEIRRAAKLGVGGVYLFPNPTNGIHYGERYYDPFWAEVEDLGLPIGIHVSSTPNYIGNQLIRHAGFNHSQWFFALAQKMDCQLCFMQFFQGAVFDRFPKLKVGVVESGCTWIAHMLDSMDAFAEGDNSTEMKLRPSEYFERQCWITGEADERAFSAIANVIGVERFHWGSDYPHEEGHAHPVKKISQCLEELSQADRDLIFGENACALYNLN